ncbi:MAG: Cache 3/Cache 2 fusion domain-containing protein, partial [Desulfamplus sp.]|nr:Cache 3/Cache 2 fusion domain-containing protein [Desulfamplus sp.]
MSIKIKIISLTVTSCFLLLLTFMINILYQERVAVEQVDQELDTLMRLNTKSVVQNVGNQLESLNDLLLTEVSNGLKVSWEALNRMGNVSLDPADTIEWNAINQFDKKAVKVSIPKMKVGGQWLGNNESISKVSPVVDHVKSLVGGTTTIFQRINEKGDMLRVCTNVETLNKTRAIGTYIPAANPDGTKNPVVEALMAGKRFDGRAYVVNAWYLTTYEPIYDSGQKIIGALYYGIMQEKTEALRKGIIKTVLGKTGHIYVLDREGRYIISKGGLRDGENVWDSKDINGNYFIQSIIKKGLSLNPGEVAYERYPLINEGETKPSMQLVAITYFKPWDWIVGAGAYEDDFKDAKVKMQSSISDMVKWGGIIGSIVLVLILLGA